MTIEADPWSEDKTKNLYYGFIPNNILTDPDNNDLLVYSALWNNRAVVGDTTRGPWAYINPDQSTTNVTDDDWEKAHPGFLHVTVTENNQTALAGTYNRKAVRWSRLKNSFIYGNYHHVNFTDEEEHQVSSLLDASIQSIERSRSSLTPQTLVSTLPGSFDAPDPVTLVPPPLQQTTSTSKGKTPETRIPPAKAQQPTPPPSKRTPATPTMSTAAKLVGTPPEQFDGTAAKAESFLSALQNYYYLNETLFADESRRVAAALSHFKVGTPAGEWARDKQNTALTGTHITYGTWQTFLDDFKKHFVPVQTEQQAMNAI
jgi:hypothetical protein